ncbi:MAG: hypothetical protein RLY86_4153, partial [Pseudomonadota bacterium]
TQNPEPPAHNPIQHRADRATEPRIRPQAIPIQINAGE